MQRRGGEVRVKGKREEDFKEGEKGKEVGGRRDREREMKREQLRRGRRRLEWKEGE